MNLVPFEQIAMVAGVSLRTVARDVQRRLLVPYSRVARRLSTQTPRPRPSTSPATGRPAKGSLPWVGSHDRDRECLRALCDPRADLATQPRDRLVGRVAGEATVSRPVRNSILGRSRRQDRKEVTLAEPSKSAAFNAPAPAAKANDAGKMARLPVAYPDRPMPLAGPQRDRWVRELVGSIVSRTAPVLLDREEAILVLDLSPATFDRRLRDGKLALESVTVVGSRDLYLREDIRAILLSSDGDSAPEQRS